MRTFSTTISFRPPLTKRAESVLEAHRGEFVTSFAALEEAVYVTLRKLISDRRGIKNRYDVKRFLKSDEGKALIREAFTSVLSLVFQFNIKLIDDVSSPGLVELYAVTYGLMPKDAQILATCAVNGVKGIATFDEDFRDIDEVEIVP
ncbi:PIN domain-containing protein [Palaeococcus ferrophilus]|uniref:PIN domain-containing protein n=1 Tax=Palaeococcus ferrophilus TaxID=83868 RepID=UPI000A018404|nr:PIN domain-containing protein [Palaeococcus ferrophilus]